MDESTGGEARARDAGGEPGLVHFSEETSNLTPTGALAGLAGIADEDDVEVQTVAGGIHHAVGAATDQVAEDGQKLQENGGRMGFGVGSDGADGKSGETVESGFAQVGIRDGSGRGRARCLAWRCRVRRRWDGWIGVKRLGMLFGLRFVQQAEEFGLASFYVGKRGQVGPTNGSGCLS
jgi:hypothetical protein